jgi:hypothetical protein
VAKWPRTNAVLIHKDISSVGGRLVFEYEVRGQRFTGVGFCWGTESLVQYALTTHGVGTTHEISYDPEDPSQIEPIQIPGWARLMGPIFRHDALHLVYRRRHGSLPMVIGGPLYRGGTRKAHIDIYA